jgi:hypothetical protein
MRFEDATSSTNGHSAPACHAAIRCPAAAAASVTRAVPAALKFSAGTRG